jgi:hypothetical protein
MSVARRLSPKYRHYKPKDLGVVRIDGSDVYLGRYNSPESLERYHRTVAEWLAGQPLSAAPRKNPEVAAASPRGILINSGILEGRNCGGSMASKVRAFH